MNERTSYEQLIAEKAGQCTVPDMADAIWATIDAGLNQLPDNTSQQGNTSNPGNTSNITGKFTGLGKLSLFAGSAILVTAVLIWLNYQQPQNLPANNSQQPQPSPVQQKKDTILLDSVEAKSVTTENSPAVTLKNYAPVLPDSTVQKNDSITNIPAAPFVMPPPVLDSAAGIPQVPADSVSAPPPVPKKPRGVKGITSDDYKIVPVKEDSADKN